ncbi:kielin/chordin-like protein [Ischnura elegans]|uniref:kielin/chordin-like protein n=1 Tax=Ischnura elegans TaxID=197161 RepID=UPI001ED8A110|nr:kielin/chordin-like protein [Ischnura elegans]
MKSLLISFVLALAFATQTFGLTEILSEDCSKCPDCLNDAHLGGYTYPNKDICKFCQCKNGVGSLEKCENGTRYDGNKGGCVHDDTGKCSCCTDCCLNECPICYHGIDFPMKNDNDKCAYCLCSKDGGIYKEKCPWGYRFNVETGSCDIRDPECGQIDCPGVKCTGGDHEEHFKDENSKDNCDFCCCKPNDTNVYYKSCPWGEKFLHGTCDESTKGQCKPPAGRSVDEFVPVNPCHGVVCPRDHTKALLKASRKSPHSYCKCQSDGEVALHHCQPGHTFDERIQSCVSTPKLTSWSDCDTVTCPADPTGYPLQVDPVNPAAYCQCDWGGKAHPMPCNPGAFFNYDYQKCL